MSKDSRYNSELPAGLESVDYLDIVFEHKNKDYGAYLLRKLNPKYVSWSFMISALTVTLIFLIPLVIVLVQNSRKDGVIKHEPKKVVKYSELSAPPPIELQQPKKAIQIPPKEAKVKYLPPVAKPDEEVPDEEEIPTIDELAEATPGTETIAGEDSVVFEGTGESEVEEPEPVVQKPFTIVEEMPEFPGGQEALLKYLQKNIRYPKMALELDVEGRVFIRFVINIDGAVSNVELVRGIGAGCDEEALRVVAAMPNWKPGLQRGKKVPVAYVLPINFELRD